MGLFIVTSPAETRKGVFETTEARAVRDLTVPTGIRSVSAVSTSERPRRYRWVTTSRYRSGNPLTVSRTVYLSTPVMTVVSGDGAAPPETGSLARRRLSRS